MRIAELTCYIVRVPLRRVIRHASATRCESTNLLVRCRLANGIEGWGEGVPRDYVTGETPEGALDQFGQTPLERQLCASPTRWSEVIELCGAFQPSVPCDDPRGCRSNSLRCAVELAILDAYGRLFAEPISTVTRHFPPARSIRHERREVRYSTTITAESAFAECRSALKMRCYGFQQCKVKVGLAGADDARRLRRIRLCLGSRVDIRIDANESWHADKLTAAVEPLLRYRISCLEQPVPHAELDSLAEVRTRLAVPIMLDESLTSMADAQRATAVRACDLFNIRLSKCGGFLNSLRLAAEASAHGLGYQLGCHPGETGILSAAGRHWATSVSNIRYLEGSYDRHVLRELLTNEDITFAYGGRAPALESPGSGVHVNPEVLASWTIRELTRPLA
jgi:muconate cycloisomerase